MSVAEVHQALGLEALKNRTFQVCVFRYGPPAPDSHCRILSTPPMSIASDRSSRRRQRKAKAWTAPWTGCRTPCNPANNTRSRRRIDSVLFISYRAYVNAPPPHTSCRLYPLPNMLCQVRCAVCGVVGARACDLNNSNNRLL